MEEPSEDSEVTAEGQALLAAQADFLVAALLALAAAPAST